MQVWRLCKREHARFDGEGARRAGGRWNQRGTPMVYASESLALAALEILVHCDPAMLPPDLVAIPADIPEAVRIEPLAEDRLPRDWRQLPAPDALAKIGTAWAQSARSPVLSVPSAVVPRERNYLLNPAHPDFARIRPGKPEAFSLDRRLQRRLRFARDLPSAPSRGSAKGPRPRD
jgi:RES domain-containing protein